MSTHYLDLGSRALLHTSVLLGCATAALGYDSRPPVYEIGKIPSVIQLSRGSPEDRPLEFVVQASRAAGPTTYSLASDRVPVGEMTVDPATGLFHFKAASRDKGIYIITFSGQSNHTLSRQKIKIIVPLLPETDLVAVPGPPPDETSENYVIISDTLGADPEFFNTASRPTRTVQISGKKIIIDDQPPTKAFQLCSYDRQSGRNANVKHLTIYADSLVVRTPFLIPQTNVVIYAKTLEFQDKSGHAPARIETTPLNFTIAAKPATATTPAEPGRPGADGGNIDLLIANLIFPPSGVSKRLVLRGGQGQDPGLGQDGAKGLDLPVYNKPIPFFGQPKDIVWIKGLEGPIFGVPNTWPGNGHDALPAGKPGSGGNGGTLRTTSASAINVAEQSGGPSGHTGRRTLGGRAGLPNPARGIVQTGPFNLRFVANPTPQRPGKDAVPPPPDTASGAPDDPSL